MNEKHQFEQLLAAYANKELTADERQRVETLAANDPERRHALAGFEQMHVWFSEERAVVAQVMAPSEPAEETDESYRRLELASLAPSAECRAPRSATRPPGGACSQTRGSGRAN